jgi:amino acid adenylation domain-containing protein
MINNNKNLFYKIEGSLSESQERFWFLQHIQPDCFGYNIPCILKIKGPLDIKLLEKSLNHILQRHEILRASFPFLDGKPAIIYNQLPYQPLEINKLERIPASSRKSEAERLMTAVVQNPFDLKYGPLIRFQLFSLNNEEHFLLLVLHQIICDTASTSILLKELIDIYQSISTAASFEEPESHQIHSNVSSSTQIMTPDQTQAHLAYWENQLNNLPVSELPTIEVRPSFQTYTGSSQSLRLPVEIYQSLQQLSRQADVDVQLILLGVLQTLLYRYTQKPDLAVGYPVPGRTAGNTSGLIGCFENLLVVRTKFPEKTSFLQLLARLKITFKDALDHQEVSFANIVRVLKADRDLARTPFFQVLFRYSSAPAVYGQTHDLLFEEIESAVGLASYDLTLKIVHQGDSINCIFNYNTDLFDAAAIARLIGHFQTLLNSLLANPEEQIGLLPLLTADEKQRMLVEWNATAAPYPKDQCLHELFETQASRTPQAMALDFLGRQLTYQELDVAANQLAHYLTNLGVGPEIPVGICLESSIEMMIGILGILKAGGCYVILDLEYPRDRIAFMLEDTQARVLLTRQNILKNLSGLNIHTIFLDGDQDRIAQESPERVAVKTKSTFPACIFYTSGSTGKPKGVPVFHYAINRLVINTNYVHFLSSDRVAQASNISFDVATCEIWGSLLNGGCLVGLPREIVMSPVDLANFLREEKIDVLCLTPALFHQCAREVPDAFQTVRDLIIAGEILETRWVREVLMHGPPTRLVNAYGPTEGTTFATWYEVASLPQENRSIPIGRPISNDTIYILDQNLQPVPIGVTGELHIGGDGLALGYLNRPEQTAEKFVSNPFHPDPSSRLYKTGDLSRFLPDGNVEFLGRIDHQMKIRGFRIEPGEIEEALLGYPGVKAALALLREVNPGDKRLMAYIVTSEKASLTSEALRNFLHDLLPSYMIPSFFVFLDKFPLNPNGKIDRKALPEPNLSELISSRGYVAPRDKVEKQLTEVWEKVLGVQPIGVFDDFFSLGGHSLLGARMFIHLEKLFDTKVPLYVLYQRTTIAHLAEVFRNRRLLDNVTSSILEPIIPSGKNPPFFMINLLGSVPTLKRYLGSEQPYYYLKSPLDITETNFIGSSLEEIAAHYLELIRQVQPKGPYFIGGYCAGGKLAQALAHKIEEQGDELAFLFLLDPTPPSVKHYPVTLIYYRTIYKHLITLPFKEKLIYLKKAILRKLFRTIIDLFHKNSIQVPQLLHKYAGEHLSYMDSLSLISDYIPKPITNRILLILSNPDAPELQYNWSDILKGQVEVVNYNIPHGGFLFPPYSEIWVSHLKKKLQEIQVAIRKDS